MKKDRAAFAVHQLKEQGLTLATCESLTGGMLGEAVTAVPGASAVYRGGFITYTNEMKHELAAVPEEVLSRKGAVSKKCAALHDGERRTRTVGGQTRRSCLYRNPCVRKYACQEMQF